MKLNARIQARIQPKPRRSFLDRNADFITGVLKCKSRLGSSRRKHAAPSSAEIQNILLEF